MCYYKNNLLNQRLVQEVCTGILDELCGQNTSQPPPHPPPPPSTTATVIDTETTTVLEQPPSESSTVPVQFSPRQRPHEGPERMRLKRKLFQLKKLINQILFML